MALVLGWVFLVAVNYEIIVFEWKKYLDISEYLCKYSCKNVPKNTSEARELCTQWISNRCLLCNKIHIVCMYIRDELNTNKQAYCRFIFQYYHLPIALAVVEYIHSFNVVRPPKFYM